MRLARSRPASRSRKVLASFVEGELRGLAVVFEAVALIAEEALGDA